MGLPPLHSLSLFSGVGGLDLGVRAALGRDRVRTVCFVEQDAFCQAVLVARMAEAALDQAPVWSDAESFDGAPWRGVVDLVTAGFPCQPASGAGKRAGVADERWLWPLVESQLRSIRPGLVFLENVPGLLSVDGGRAMGTVLGSLASLGYDAQWGLFSAAEVGAPHQRDRWFCLAYADGDSLRHLRERIAGRGDAPRDDVDGCDPPVGDADRAGRERLIAPPLEPTEPGHRFPPGPSDGSGWQRWISEGRPEPCLRRGADGVAVGMDRPVHRRERLRVCGNGVVPQQAARALVELAGR